MNQPNLGAPRTYVVPAIAHRQADVYRDGLDLAPRKDDNAYRQYKFLGRLPVEEYADTWAARDEARTRFGKRANVFRTARFWVAYAVQ